MFTAASFFSGFGAMDLSAVAAFNGDLDIRHLCEIDPFKRGLLKKHRRFWHNATYHKDIQEVSPDDFKNIDIIYGGFPCTEISNAGHKRGLASGESALWYNLYNIISTTRPIGIVLENVPAIVHRGGKTITAQLAQLGYDGMWLTIPAYAFGSPQYRTRWFYVGYANSQRYTGTKHPEIHSAQIGTHLPRQQIQKPNANLTTGHRRRGNGLRKSIRRNQPTLVRNASRDAQRLVTSHKFPEPFCGGASIFFQKSPSPIETLNDLNSNVITFFEVLHQSPEELINWIQLTPYSRQVWENAHNTRADASKLEIARDFYIRSRMSFDSGEGKWKSGWRYMKNNRRGKTVTQEWNDVTMLWAAANRLKDAQLENDDALDVIRRFDGPETLFYIDPPYMFDTRHSNEEYYAFEMTDIEHIVLGKLLQQVKGMVILSGYDHPLYQQLYADWAFVEKPARTNGNHKSTECLWINPSANALNKLPLFANL